MKINKDIKRKIDKKVIEPSYEPGSRAMYLPILEDLFPKLFGSKMRSIPHYFIIAGNRKYNVKEEFYKNIKEGEELNFSYDEKHRFVSLSLA